jgi:hypothetical protein
MLDHLLSAAISIIQLINKSSYIATNIIMMAWSITYHSWITFVLLLWASMLWMMPNQRRAMLRCSPFLVCYAMMLLIAQYIYSMDLTEQELPQEVQGFNLRQIGLEKPLELPVKPLLAKVSEWRWKWVEGRGISLTTFLERSYSLTNKCTCLQLTLAMPWQSWSIHVVSLIVNGTHRLRVSID